MESIIIKALDGYPLYGYRISNYNEQCRGVIQFHAGTVIRKEFYRSFVEQLSQITCCDVVLFDYRGVGESRPKSLNGFEAGISHWGLYDAPGVLEWIKSEYANVPIHLLAHSMGGQILGLMNNWEDFSKIIMIASSSGNWHNFEKKYRRQTEWLARLLFPIILRTVGYGPARFGLGQDWPRQVAEEWAGNAKQNSLMADYMKDKHANTYYSDINKEVLAWFFPDDHMATPRTVDNLQKSYPNAIIEAVSIDPNSIGLDSIGHFGLFKNLDNPVLINRIKNYLLNEKSSQQ